tara:strand:- start:1285 stop:1812 length:528 start_codon:yes stop_codon:yes gene_type:complete
MTSRLLVDKLEGKTTSGTIQMPAGQVLQVINCTSNARLETNSGTYTDLGGMSISITPKFSNSGIIGFYQCHAYLAAGSQTWHGVEYRILRDSTVVTAVTSGGNNGYGTAHAGTNDNSYRHMVYVFQSFDDYNHGSTSALTYKVQVANTNGSTGTHDNNQPGYGQGGRMTIMEVQV